MLPVVHAHCPLCTGAIGVATVSAKYYGVDSSIIGLLVGAFGISTGLWMGQRIGKYIPLIVLASFLLTIIPLQAVSNENIYLPVLWWGPAGSLLNKVYWLNKFITGSIIGGIVTMTAFWLHTTIKRSNGRVLFPYQGVVMTLSLLLLSGIGLYFVGA